MIASEQTVCVTLWAASVAPLVGYLVALVFPVEEGAALARKSSDR